MLCPDCRCPAPGGTPCPRCGHQVPERESFSGQGSHYLRVLFFLPLLWLVAIVLLNTITHGFQTALLQLVSKGWLWIYLAVSLLPISIGLHYWSMLREEEVTVTDLYIARRSHWGDEHLAWADVQEFRRKPVLFRQTRLGRIAGLSRLFTHGKLVSDLLPATYELVRKPDANGISAVMSLEPGTIDDMPWLLQLIEERLGPPVGG